MKKKIEMTKKSQKNHIQKCPVTLFSGSGSETSTSITIYHPVCMSQT